MAPPAYERLHQQSRADRSGVRQRRPMPPVPCHNDLLPGNILFADDRVWLLDFEYAGMNDVFFDLGNLSVNSELGHDAEERLLQLLLRSGHQDVVGPAATDEDDERVPRGDVGGRAAGDQLTRHRLRVVCQRAAGNCERLASRPEFESWLADAAESARLNRRATTRDGVASPRGNPISLSAKLQLSDSSSRSIAINSSLVPCTLGPVNHFRALRRQ